MKKLMYVTVWFFITGMVILSCNKNNDNDTPTQGIIKGKVTNDASAGIANVRVIVFNSNTNAPAGSSGKTGSDGSYEIKLDPGTYYLTLSMQGYNEIPSAGITPVALTVEVGKETVFDFQMQSSSITNGGFISGKVTLDGNALQGVLVIASDSINGNGFSSVTAADGTYIVYNVPAGTYQLKGFLSGYNSSKLTGVSVVAITETSGKNIVMTSGTKGCITGKVSFIAGAVSNEADVTLTDPYTKLTIPGLVTKTQSGNYKINNVPNGRYIVKASYANDGNVVDPDRIVKFGEPMITISGDTLTQDFSITGAVKLASPTNDSITIKPIEVTGTTPTFTWVAYPSTSDYIIEVSDINGTVIWGGFTKSSNTITKNITIKSSQLSIVFNNDGKATSTLKPENIYRWRIYASKNDVSAQGWHLISVSEEQRGLFIIK